MSSIHTHKYTCTHTHTHTHTDTHTHTHTQVDMPHFKVGDLVTVERDFMKVTKLQKGHGECGHCTSSVRYYSAKILRVENHYELMSLL